MSRATPVLATGVSQAAPHDDVPFDLALGMTLRRIFFPDGRSSPTLGRVVLGGIGPVPGETAVDPEEVRRWMLPFLDKTYETHALLILEVPDGTSADVEIWNLATRDTTDLAPGERYVLCLSLGLLDEVGIDIAVIDGRTVRGQMASALIDHVRSMRRTFLEGPVALSDHLAHAMWALMLAAFSSFVPLADDRDPDAIRRERIERFIEARLTEHDLSMFSIRVTFGLSRSTLYRLFATYGGVASFIRRQRLRQIRAILMANQDMRPLVEIATTYGFVTNAHFSRSFREEFGVAPSEFRRMCQGRLPGTDH
jgi:AraC-like DNA-binding protein